MEQGQVSVSGTALKRGTKAALIRECLAQGWENKKIVDHILLKYPTEARKNVQTLVWRYRQYLTGKPIDGPKA